MRSAQLAVQLALLLGTATAGWAQTLAHRGWEGSGLAADPWWRTAVFYQLDPATFQAATAPNGAIPAVSELSGVAAHLGYLQSLSVDAIILSPLQLGTAKTGAAPTLDPACGTLDDFDDLVQQASGRKIRVMVDLPLSSTKNANYLTSLARFWLSRGVAGLRVMLDPADKTPPTPDQVDAALHALHQVVASFVGQRFLLVDTGYGAAPTAPTPSPVTAASTPASPAGGKGRRMASSATSPAAQLTLDSHVGFLTQLRGPELRDALATAEPAGRLASVAPVFATDRTGQPRSFVRYGDGLHDLAIARLMATILLTNRSAVIVYGGQELGLSDASTAMPWGSPRTDARGKPLPPTGTNVLAEDANPASLLNWYRQLSALHHGNPALASGVSTLLDTGNPDVVAWLRKPAAGGVAVMLCNLSGKAVHVSILTAIRTATGQHNGFLHSLLPSVDPSMYTPPASIEDVPLPAYGVYLGELRR